MILSDSSPALLKAGMSGNNRPGVTPKMTRRFDVGDHMTWNSEAGQVGGKIIKVHTAEAACPIFF